MGYVGFGLVKLCCLGRGALRYVEFHGVGLGWVSLSNVGLSWVSLVCVWLGWGWFVKVVLS